MIDAKKNSVLIVDDETSNLMELTHILQSDYTVYAAKNGMVAIEAAIKHQPDVILLDIIMPEMDGYIVITALKKLERTQNIPVIFITGLSDAADEERGLALGAADYLIKPFSPALVKLRVLNQIKLIEQFRMNEYDIMKYKLSNDALNIALWDMDVISSDVVNPKNKFTWSQEFRQMLGFNDENDFPNLLKSWSDRLHPDDRERIINAFAAHLSDFSGKTPYDVENRLMIKTGEYRYFRALGTTHRNKDGVPVRTAGALMDITEKKQMEQEISDNIAKIEADAHWYKSILDAIPLPITVTDADMNWTFVNKAVEDFLGTKLEDMLGKHCSNWNAEICGTENCGIACAKRGIKRTFFNHNESSYQVDVEILHDIEGETAGFIEVVQDITNIQQLAKERAEVEMTSKAKSAFLANMSHEIRTPMNAIWGITEIILQNRDLPEETLEGLGKIQNSCDLLLGIINDILDFSKIEAGKIDITPEEYSVAGLINDSINLNIMRIGGKPIKLEVQVDEKIPSKLIGDQLRIKQILNNLLSNAFKYTDEGKVTLTVVSEINRQGGITLVISVSDTGNGMTAEQVEKLFDEYSRFNQDSGKTIEGTGLGLSITHRLVNLMDGEIIVESIKGKGSLFTVKLPHGKVNDEVLGKDVAESLRQFRLRYASNMKKSQIVRHFMPYGSILVVDDVETNLYVARGLIKPYGLKIETAMSGDEALNLIKSGKSYDIIFMDHMMPEMDGISTTKHLRNSGYSKPIVALTANAVAGQADIFLQSGFDAFLPKPIDIRMLDLILNKFVRDKQPEDVIEAASKQATVSRDSDSLLRADSPLLESFIRDARKTVAFLEEFCKSHQTADCYDRKNLRIFTVTVHGIKSALDDIGESKLSKSAYRLETAGRKPDTELIKNETPEFLKQLNELLEKNESEQRANDLPVTDEEPGELLEKLSYIIDLCASYNRKDILDALADTGKYSKKTRLILDKIKEYALHSDFEEAERSAAEYKDALSFVNTANIATPKNLSESGEETAMEMLKKGIDGLNIEKGLERYYGDTETYLKILRSFAVNARSMLDSMKTIDKNNLKNYEITVHGFKGMSFDIFADQIGEQAKKLEFAAKDSDFKYIQEHNPPFLETAGKLIENIDNMLSALSSKKPKPEKVKPDAQSLSKLATACKIYDMDGVDAAMAEIDAYTYVGDDGLALWLRACVDVMDYPQIVKKLSDKI